MNSTNILSRLKKIALTLCLILFFCALIITSVRGWVHILNTVFEKDSLVALLLPILALVIIFMEKKRQKNIKNLTIWNAFPYFTMAIVFIGLISSGVSKINSFNDIYVLIYMLATFILLGVYVNFQIQEYKKAIVAAKSNI